VLVAFRLSSFSRWDTWKKWHDFPRCTSSSSYPSSSSSSTTRLHLGGLGLAVAAFEIASQRRRPNVKGAKVLTVLRCAEQTGAQNVLTVTEVYQLILGRKGFALRKIHRFGSCWCCNVVTNIPSQKVNALTFGSFSERAGYSDANPWEMVGNARTILESHAARDFILKKLANRKLCHLTTYTYVYCILHIIEQSPGLNI